jgi:putative ABC transport system permease protein
MIPFFSTRLAAREGRSGFRRIGVFMGAIALGVGALTGLHAFQLDASEGVRAEARNLMGGDLRLQSSTAFSETVLQVLDSLEASGVEVARAVSLASALPAADGGARLLQLNGVDAAYPLVQPPTEFGSPGVWARLRAGGSLAAEPDVLAQLGVVEGDSLRLGAVRVGVAGGVSGLPVDLGIQTIVGPPVFVSLETLEDAGLLGFGSLAQFRAFLVLPPSADPEAEARRLRERLQGEGVSVRTARAEAESLAEGFRSLSRFLGLVGLMALLLGGIGVASAVHVHVRERIASIAVLRCLGAREGTVFRAYLLQALALGLSGALLGILLGLGLQRGLPLFLQGMLPFEAQPRLRWSTLVAGLALGSWVSFLFALLPLLRVREIPPLAALRAEVEGMALRRVLPRAVAGVGLGATLLLLSSLQTGGVLQGAAFALVLGLVLLLLAGVSRVLAGAARRFLPPSAPFVLRQGVSGLFRPGNQTGAVLVAMGFGAFLMASLLVAESGLRSRLVLDPGGGEPSLVLFDVQTDQREAVEALLGAAGAPTELVPLVPARLSAVRGESVDLLVEEDRIPGWMGRRVYRNTWRGALSATETLVSGSWAAEGDGEAVRQAVEEGAARVSLESEMATELGVGVGDRLDWDVQGRRIPSVVSSIRIVDWTSFRPNFYAVFEPAALAEAPTTWLGLIPTLPEGEKGEIQDALRALAPNVSILDVSAIRETVERVSRQVVLVLRALAAFATGGGFLVLFAALLTGRFRRRRESALLKTLGARSGMIRGILLTEYALLGLVGAAAGLLLGAGGGSLLLRQVFDTPAPIPWASLASLGIGLVALTTVAGWSVSGPVLRETPLVVLRDEG